MDEQRQTTVASIVCCKCGKHLGVKEIVGPPGSITHGLCEPCADAIWWESFGYDRPLKKATV